MKKIYIIGIGGIGISGIARFYNENGYSVFGSDKTNSELIEKMKNEGINIIIGEDEKRLENFFLSSTSGREIESDDLVVYTEAVPKSQSELKKAINLGLQIQTYPEALAKIANAKTLIGITGTHGKSTTTSMISIVLKNSVENVNALVGSLLTEFGGKNVYFSNSKYFVLEACEYKRSFLKYKPFIGVITNIDLDHLDYYKDLPDYIGAFSDYADNIVSGGYLILNGDCENSKSLIGKRKDINYVLVFDDKFEIQPSPLARLLPGDRGELIPPVNNGMLDGVYNFPTLTLKVPGKHIEFDAKLAYVVGKIIGINENKIKESLENYNGIWRRSEIIGNTKNNNILMSDYGHHPTEISLNLEALKKKYNNTSPLAPLLTGEGKSRKIVTVFQPHQYNRTLELLKDFKNCFNNTDILIIPDIYESRDSEEDKKKIDGKKLIEYINHPHKIFGNGLKNTLEIIKKLDEENPSELVIILQGAGNVDDLRYEIEVKK